MIESIEFTNFKALRKTNLPLAPFTLLLGPNGSGKTSVLQALRGIPAVLHPPSQQDRVDHASLLSITAKDQKDYAGVKLLLRLDKQASVAEFKWNRNGGSSYQFCTESGNRLNPNEVSIFAQWLRQIQIYSLDASAIAEPAEVTSGPLHENGAGLAAVLDDLKDNHLERWEALLAEFRRWIPEYDYIMFDKPQAGSKAIVLRTKLGGHRIAAKDLSQGTLIALALLTLAYLPDPPSLVGLEEIDRGLHPRLLRHLQDALYRLSYPESCGESRSPIQVIATTHSPYLLDLYRDHPEEIVLSEKQGLEVQMKRLTDIENYDEILGDAPLSEVWYSGVLGGVAVKP